MLVRREGRSVDIRAVARFLVRSSRRLAITLGGFALVFFGLAGLILPILPGWALIIAGFLVLSREYAWANSCVAFCRRHAARHGAKVRHLAGRASPRRMVILPSDDTVIDLTQNDAAPDAPAEEPLRRSERSA